MNPRSPPAFWLLALLLAGGGACRPTARGEITETAKATSATAPLSFIEDDYPAALAKARALGVPLFVDAWAPWCHTCLSMKAYVFGDPALAPLVTRFVWAAVDTEKAASEPFTKKFPMEAWPTLWVIDPGTETALLKWQGSATASELVLLLEQATGGSVSKGPGSVEATAAWLRGNHAVAGGQRDTAAKEYREALSRAPEGWSGRAAVVEAFVTQLQALERNEECLAVSLREWPLLPRGTSRLNVVLGGLGCGSAMPKAAEREGALAALAQEATRMVGDPGEPVLADDRSSLFEELVNFQRWENRPNEAKAMAEKWRDFLDGEAARAPSPAARVVFDSHRMLAYTESGETERAIPMLEQSERDFPADYNAPSRLARVNLDLGRFEIALAAIGRAEARVEGPRKMRVLWLKADILQAMKRPDEAKRALAEAAAFGGRRELTGGYRKLLEKIEKRLQEP